MTIGSYKSDDGHERPPKMAVFMKRRSSAGPDGRLDTNTVPIKASLEEMRRQIRLGPANRAANPRSNTRGSVFKIKQGLGPHADGAKISSEQVTPTIEITEGEHETTPLLGPAQNGAHAEEDYGTDASKQGKLNKKK